MRPTTTSSARAGFVEFQQRLARTALDRGELGAARVALRVLRPSDFVGGAAACEAYFAVLREHRAPEAEIRDAIEAIIRLHPAGSERSASRPG